MGPQTAGSSLPSPVSGMAEDSDQSPSQHHEHPYNNNDNFVDASHIMDHQILHSAIDEQFWQMNDMLPQMPAVGNNNSMHQGFPSLASFSTTRVDSTEKTPMASRRPLLAQLGASSSPWLSTQPLLNQPVPNPNHSFSPSYNTSSQSPASEIYLCKVCYNLVASRIVNNTVHLADANCIICHGKVPSACANLKASISASNDTNPTTESSRRHFMTSVGAQSKPPKTIPRNARKTNKHGSTIYPFRFDSAKRGAVPKHQIPLRIAKRRLKPRHYSDPKPISRHVSKADHAGNKLDHSDDSGANKSQSKPKHCSALKRTSGGSSLQKKEGIYYCRHEGCHLNRGPGGEPFKRKDNARTHEKKSHGVDYGRYRDLPEA